MPPSLSNTEALRPDSAPPPPKAAASQSVAPDPVTLQAAIRAADPNISTDAARLLAAHMALEARAPTVHSIEAANVQGDALAYVHAFKQSYPMAWPAMIAADVSRFAKTMAAYESPADASRSLYEEAIAALTAPLPSRP